MMKTKNNHPIKTTIDNVEKAKIAWADEAQGVPDWVLELAAQCNASSQSAAAKKIGYGSSTISQVLSNTYAGNMDRMKQMIEGAFMASVVNCPVLGEIGRNRCLIEQKQPFRATSAHRAQLYHACRGGCPFSRNTNIDGETS